LRSAKCIKIGQKRADSASYPPIKREKACKTGIFSTRHLENLSFPGLFRAHDA
jgi:hypothetical protein